MTNDQGVTKSENVRHGDDLFWNDDETAFVREELYTKPVYDLEERTARFGEAVIDFAKTIPQSAVTTRIISQLVGAGTSVGANYVEADDAVSKKEFLKNIGTCKKEARETKHFLRMSAKRLLKPATKARGPDTFTHPRGIAMIGRFISATRPTRQNSRPSRSSL